MLDMSSWKRRTFDVTNELRLDPKNVRLGPSLQSDPPQADIIQDLFQTEGAFDIARSIATVGFFTHEVPVVLSEGGQWIVVEGNRRTAALKALQNPFLVPAFQSRLADLLSTNPIPATLANIECVIAPDRDSANRLIATLHTTNPRKPWGPLRQADFFGTQLAAGKTAAQLIEEYPGIPVAEFIETAEMHKLLQSTEYGDDELDRYVRLRSFPISTFKRLYENPEFRKLAKIEVAEETGHVLLNGKRSDFDKLAIKVVGDMKDKRIDTRVLNKPSDPSYTKYMRDLQPLAVRSSKTVEKVADLPPIAALPAKPKVATTLDVSGLYPPAAFPAIGSILVELSKLRYQEFPNATFDLIRTFMEKSIKAYAESLGQDIPKKGAYVYFDSALEWLMSDVAKAPGKRSLVQVIKKLRQDQKMNVYAYGLTGDYLNAANHNHQIFIDKTEVLNLWNSVINLMRYVLREELA